MNGDIRSVLPPGAVDCATCATWLAEHVVGLLEPDDDARIAAHCESCSTCGEAARRLRDEMAILTAGYEDVSPPAGLWSKVERRVAEERTRAEAEAESLARAALPFGSSLIRAASGGWTETSVPGVRRRILHEDAANDRRTALYQMDPGSHYPAHVHGGVEECFVLSGDLSHGDVRMGPGDYQRVTGESHHEVQTTEGGCLLFIVCSMSDRFVG